MKESTSSCFRCVCGIKICNYCGGKIIKHGIMKTGKQRYKCKDCSKTQVDYYTYQAYRSSINNKIIALNNEGLGILSISRYLKISPTTLLKRIIQIAQNIEPPPIYKARIYEVDELKTYYKKKKKKIWVVCALERGTKNIVSFNVGRRTTNTIKAVTDSLLLSEAQTIYTDKLNIYRTLIPKSIHKTKYRGTNHVERQNLELRKNIKRLNRRMICYTKKLEMLRAILKIYFFT